MTGCGRSKTRMGDLSRACRAEIEERETRRLKERQRVRGAHAETRASEAARRSAAMRCAASEWIRAHGGCLWLTEATKGAAGRERPRGGASSRGSADTRMGQPAAREVRHPP